MPKNGKKQRKIPKHGRSLGEINEELGLQTYSADVPIGNTDPTVVQGVMHGGMPNASRRAKGRLRELRGKRT